VFYLDAGGGEARAGTVGPLCMYM